MIQQFTKNHLVKFIYKETSAAENMAVNEALDADPSLAGAYEDLLQGKQQLPKVTFNPSSSTIQNILKYSESTAVETQF